MARKIRKPCGRSLWPGRLGDSLKMRQKGVARDEKQREMIARRMERRLRKPVLSRCVPVRGNNSLPRFLHYPAGLLFRVARFGRAPTVRGARDHTSPGRQRSLNRVDPCASFATSSASRASASEAQPLAVHLAILSMPRNHATAALLCDGPLSRHRPPAR
jgi:hypothetical protein